MSGYIFGVYVGLYKVLLELYLGSVPQASDLIYMQVCGVAGRGSCGRMSMCAHTGVDGWVGACSLADIGLG